MTETESAPQTAAAPLPHKPKEPTVTTKIRSNPVHALAVLIVVAFAGFAVYISFAHQIELARRYGVHGWQATTAPFFMDGFMLLGRLGQSSKFDASTNKIGRRMMAAAALVSFIANVLVGNNLGERVYGAMIVIGFIAAEWYAGKLKPAPAGSTRKLDPQTAKERAEKAAATRARKADAELTRGQKAARTRAKNRAIDAELAAITAGSVPSNAPVSPAV